MADTEGAGPGWLGEPVAVHVRNRFDGTWTHGFEIVERLTDDDGQDRYRLRRSSDGSILPVCFPADQILRPSHPDR